MACLQQRGGPHCPASPGFPPSRADPRPGPACASSPLAGPSGLSVASTPSLSPPGGISHVVLRYKPQSFQSCTTHNTDVNKVRSPAPKASCTRSPLLPAPLSPGSPPGRPGPQPAAPSGSPAHRPEEAPGSDANGHHMESGLSPNGLQPGTRKGPGSPPPVSGAPQFLSAHIWPHTTQV